MREREREREGGRERERERFGEHLLPSLCIKPIVTLPCSHGTVLDMVGW